MTTFFHWFVVSISVASILGCLWLLFANARGVPGEVKDHSWDDDLREYNNPLPRWWLVMFVLTILFSVGYLAFYPGLGNVGGRLGWTSTGEMETRLQQLTAQRQEQIDRLAALPIEAIAADPGGQSMGRSLFLAHCAGCHGADARGAIGFPNLTDDDWLYGGAPDTIVASITGGRSGQMPHFNGSLTPEKLDALLAFLPRWSDPKLGAEARAAGLKAYAGVCAACHGAEGHGNPALGAPNLTDTVWLWGGEREQIRQTLLFGRLNHMPAHDKLMSPGEIRVVAGYVYGLSREP